MRRKCKSCGSVDGLREAIYGMPAFPLDEKKYFIAGCTTEGPKYICEICGWGKDQIREWMPEGMEWRGFPVGIDNQYRKGQTIFIREDGAKIILDSIEGEGINMVVHAHVVDENGKEYPIQLLENITKFGYWEPMV